MLPHAVHQLFNQCSHWWTIHQHHVVQSIAACQVLQHASPHAAVLADSIAKELEYLLMSLLVGQAGGRRCCTSLQVRQTVTHVQPLDFSPCALTPRRVACAPSCPITSFDHGTGLQPDKADQPHTACAGGLTGPCPPASMSA